MNQRLRLVAALVAALALGAILAVAVDRASWNNELSLQLAQKEQVIADLRADLQELRSGLETLKANNEALRTLIEASVRDAADVARSNKSSVEKLRNVIARLETLKASLTAP